MTSPNRKFRISAYVAEVIEMYRFSAPTAKLFYTLIFLQDQTEESWPTILFEGDKPTEHFVFINQLRELCFPAKTGSSRFLRKPVNELAAISDIFDILEISKNGRFLKWKFTEGFFHTMSDMDIYALIDASEIGHCQLKFDGALLAQIALHRKKRVPEFSLIAPNKGFESGPDAVIPALIPGEIKRQLRPSLKNWSNITGISFAVLLVQGGVRPGYTDVVIRMRHKDTKWPDGRFMKQPPDHFCGLLSQRPTKHTDSRSGSFFRISQRRVLSPIGPAFTSPEGPAFFLLQKNRVSGLTNFFKNRTTDLTALYEG